MDRYDNLRSRPRNKRLTQGLVQRLKTLSLKGSKMGFSETVFWTRL